MSGAFKVGGSSLENIRANTDRRKESTTNEIDLTDDGPDAVERMVEYFYSGDYHDAAAEQNENLVRLTLHIGIYSLADKYDVPGLGALAMTYFQAILSKGAKARRKDDCMPCVRSIYESTPDSNTGLRDLFVDHVVESYMNDKWKKSEPLLKAAFLEIPQFGWDCFLRIQNGPNETMNDIWRKLRRH